jgi:hypothetical protein
MSKFIIIYILKDKAMGFCPAASKCYLQIPGFVTAHFDY